MPNIELPDTNKLILLDENGKLITSLHSYDCAKVCILNSDKIKDKIDEINELISRSSTNMPKIPTHIGVYKIHEDIEYGWIDWEPITKEILILYDAKVIDLK